jgi:hypothetical protein
MRCDFAILVGMQEPNKEASGNNESSRQSEEHQPAHGGVATHWNFSGLRSHRADKPPTRSMFLLLIAPSPMRRSGHRSRPVFSFQMLPFQRTPRLQDENHHNCGRVSQSDRIKPLAMN